MLVNWYTKLNLCYFGYFSAGPQCGEWSFDKNCSVIKKLAKRLAKWNFVRMKLSARYRPVGWDPDQLGWSGNACATSQPWPCETSVDLDCFLERAVVGRPIVGIVGGCAANNSLHDACTRLKIVRNSFHGNVVAVLLHRHAGAGASAFGVMSVDALNRCPEHQCMQVCTLQRCCRHQRTCLWTHLIQDVNMRSCMYSLFIHVGGQVCGGSMLSTGCCDKPPHAKFKLSWGGIFDRWRDRDVVCVFFVFLRWWQYMWTYVQTHTHTHCT